MWVNLGTVVILCFLGKLYPLSSVCVHLKITTNIYLIYDFKRLYLLLPPNHKYMFNDIVHCPLLIEAQCLHICCTYMWLGQVQYFTSFAELSNTLLRVKSRSPEQESICKNMQSNEGGNGQMVKLRKAGFVSPLQPPPPFSFRETGKN